jgi:predicted RNA-binding Zn-ribbon protein involved in translation (DUF1610 family)
MADETVITTPNGSRWSPAASTDLVHCQSCNNAVDTPEEIASYPDGNCPQCGSAWTGSEGRGVVISVASPAPLGGETMP